MIPYIGISRHTQSVIACSVLKDVDGGILVHICTVMCFNMPFTNLSSLEIENTTKPEDPVPYTAQVMLTKLV